MSRHLEVVRNTCQRIVSALQEAPGPGTVTLLPGVKGLRQFIEGLHGCGFDASETDAAAVAVDGFEQLIQELAGSHARLCGRIEVSGVAEEDVVALGEVEARSALYQSAAQVTGRSAEVNVSLYVFRPSPESPGMMERASAFGLIGNWVRPGGMPLVISSGETESTADESEATLLDRAPAKGRTPEALLSEFTTMPLPTVTSRGTARGNLLQIVDPNVSAEGRLVDVVTATRSIHPEVQSDTGRRTLDHIWSLVNCPSKHHVFDVYLHRDMERLYRPSADVQQWNPGLSIAEGDRWATRLPVDLKLQLLGTGALGTRCEAYPRMSELTQTLLDRVGWDAAEFVGFRCEVAWPVWRSGICMSFEYVDGPG